MTQRRHSSHQSQLGTWPLITSLTLAISLTACGGGGAPESTPDVNLTPAATSSFYRVGQTEESSGGKTTRRIAIVDTRLGTIVREYETNIEEYSSTLRPYLITQRVSVDSDGLGATLQGASEFFMVQNGKVMQLSLDTPTLGTARKISSVTSACGLAYKDETDMGLDGKQLWIQVITAGPDQDCNQTEDNETVLVAANMSTSAAALAAGPQGLELLEALPTSDRTDTIGVLALNRRTQVLGVYSKDLSKQLYAVPVTDHTITADESVGVIASHSNPTKGYFHLGANLYLADWGTGSLKLGKPIAQLNETTPRDGYWPFALDAKNLYLADGNRILTIGESGNVATLATLPQEGGSIQTLSAASNALIASQYGAEWGSLATTPGPTLSSISKNNGGVSTLVSASKGDYLWGFSIAGDSVFYMHESSSSGTEIVKLDLTTKNSQTIAKSIQFVDLVVSGNSRLSDLYAFNQIVWCEPRENETSCVSGKLISYDLATGQKIELGTLPSENSSWSHIWAVDRWPSIQNTLTLGERRNHTYSSSEVSLDTSSTTLWMWNPAVANSLKAVLPAL